MPETLRWLITVEIIGIVSMPIAWVAFPYLRDRGIGLAKPLGLLLAGTVVWLGSDFGLMSNSGETYWIVIGLMFASSLWLLSSRRRRFGRFLRREWPALVVGEALFLAFFIGWAVVRSHQPDISGTEKPMELLMLNAVTVAEHAPPDDPWLAGESVAYYYFGYWLLGGVGLMAGVVPAIGFNLSIALIAGMAASAVFSVAYGMILPGRMRDRAAVPIAVFAALLLLVASNYAGLWEFGAAKSVGPDGFYEWLDIDGVEPGAAANRWRPDSFWWWWHSSRVINTFEGDVGLDFTIQEFPAFSLVLGDLHPHLISIPFLLLFVGLVFNYLRTPGGGRPGQLVSRPRLWILLSVVIGALGFINAWDLGFAAALLLAVMSIKIYRHEAITLPVAAVNGMVSTALVVGLGLVVYSGFYFGTFSSQVDWAAPLGAARHATRPVHLLTVWGLFVVLMAPLWISAAGRVVGAYKRGFTRPDATPEIAKPGVTPATTALIATVSPFVLWTVVHVSANDGSSWGDVSARMLDVLPLALVSGLAIAAVIYAAKRANSAALMFPLVLMAVAIYMVYGSEMLYINDLFGGRMNTVFKLYYQAWIVLSLVGAFGLHFWIRNHQNWGGVRRSLSETGAVIAAVMVVGALYYPAAAIDTRTEGFSGEQSLDGMAFIGNFHPGEIEAIDWLNKNSRKNAVLVEAVGGSYTDFGRISSSTGIPTVLGWPFHEEQWRGDRTAFDGREEDVQRIYESVDLEEVRMTLALYDIDYVVVGLRERSTYSGLDLDRLAGIGELVYPADTEDLGPRDYVIFDVGGS